MQVIFKKSLLIQILAENCDFLILMTKAYIYEAFLFISPFFLYPIDCGLAGSVLFGISG